MRGFDYARVDSLEAAVAALAPRRRPLAGGTDLLTLLKADVASVDALVDLKKADLPRTIEPTDRGVRIGALATLAEVEASPLLRERYKLLGQAAAATATRQIRNRATIGGNLLQRPRCTYFRIRHASCWLNGGESCLAVDGRNEHHAIYGGGMCRAAHPSDLAGCLLALDAAVTLHGSRRSRRMPLRELYALPDAQRRTETVIETDELLISLDLPALSPEWRTTYVKAMDRKAWAFALAGVALAIRAPAGRIEEARVVLTGVAPIPWRHSACEARLIGARLDRDDAAPAIDAVGDGAEPLAENGYKVELTKRLLARALVEAG